jgi:hypothetical protein
MQANNAANPRWLLMLAQYKNNTIATAPQIYTVFFVNLTFKSLQKPSVK